LLLYSTEIICILSLTVFSSAFTKQPAFLLMNRNPSSLTSPFKKVVSKTLGFCVFFSFLLLVSPVEAFRPIAVDEENVALRGYDPVAYFRLGRPARSSPLMFAKGWNSSEVARRQQDLRAQGFTLVTPPRQLREPLGHKRLLSMGPDGPPERLVESLSAFSMQ
jgi:hypothetical protein